MDPGTNERASLGLAQPHTLPVWVYQFFVELFTQLNDMPWDGSTTSLYLPIQGTGRYIAFTLAYLQSLI